MNPYPLRCVILEDEDDILKWLVKTLSQYSEIELVGTATNIDEAFMLIANEKPDAAFMDVQLIGGDAFTLLNRLEKNKVPIPNIVMATGYPEYVMTALNEYRAYVVQYLVKPFLEDWETKFRKAIDALIAAKMKNLQVETSSTPKKDTSSGHTFLQNRGSLFRVDFEALVYLEAAGGGESILVTTEGNNQVDLTLNKFLEILPKEHFFRISKSNIINTSRVLSINRSERTVEMDCGDRSKSVGVSDTYYMKLLDKLPLAKDQLGRKNN
jgi:DNA-binding LytR/AlgR family response regulator